MKILIKLTKILCLLSLPFSFSYSQEFDRTVLHEQENHLVSIYGIKELDILDPIDNIISEELDRLNEVIQHDLKVLTGNPPTSFSHPKLGIVLNKVELSRIKEQVGIQEMRNIARLILFHEAAHQLQYRHYGADIVNIGEIDIIKSFECQADILAGKYITASLPEGNDTKIQILDALETMFAIGTQEFTTDVDHPSHEERRTAIRIGMACGMIDRFNLSLSKMNSDPYAPELIKQSMISSISRIRESINFLPSEEIIDWSLRLAKRIVQYKNDLRYKIILIDSKINCDESPNNPIFNYSLTYKNISSQKLQIDMEVESRMVDKIEPYNTMKTYKMFANSYQFTIEPGSTHTIDGKLYWSDGNNTDASKKPELIFAPRLTSMFSCESEDLNIRINSIKTNQSFESLTDEQIKTVSVAINRIIQTGIFNSNSLKGSVGEVVNNENIFYSSISIPGAIETKIYERNEKNIIIPRIKAVYYIGSSADEADNMIQTLADTLKKDLQDHWTFEESESNESNLKYRKITFNSSSNHFKILLIRTEDSDDIFKVNLEIEWPI